MRSKTPFEREVGRGLDATALPPYAAMLAAYHRAHAGELRRMVADLPLRPGMRVLDMACGDGVYACWLAERVAPAGRVVGVDISLAYLEQARAAAAPEAARIDFARGDIAGLPYADASFDLAWCAQSMYSLPDPRAALRELRRVTRPGGAVAVFENDALHQLILPWPADLELAVRQAQLAALRADGADLAKFFTGRDLYALFQAEGLTRCSIRAYSSVRQAPLSPDEATFLGWYLADLRCRARPYLSPADQQRFDALSEPASPAYMLRHPAFTATYLDIVAVGVV